MIASGQWSVAGDGQCNRVRLTNNGYFVVVVVVVTMITMITMIEVAKSDKVNTVLSVSLALFCLLRSPLAPGRAAGQTRASAPSRERAPSRAATGHLPP